MNQKEKEMFKDIQETVRSLRSSVNDFETLMKQRVDNLESIVTNKHLPITLEMDVLQTLQQSMNEAIKTNLTGYNNPLQRLISVVVENHSLELKTIISESFVQVIKTKEFKASIVSAFSHKVSRSIISNNDGLFDKVSNQLKQDSTFKAKMTLAVSNVVEECLTKEQKDQINGN